MKINILFATFLLVAGNSFAQPQQWTEISSGTNKKLNVIDFPSVNVGYIGGNDSLILKTTDGGRNWSEINYSGVTFFPGGEHIVNLKFVNELVGFMTVGPYSGTYKTVDGGLNWTQIQNLSMCYNHGLYFFDENNGFVGGSGCFQGELIERLSGGVWSPATINTSTWDAQNRITDIDFLDANFGLASSRGGYILRTTDGGLNWDTIPSPAPAGNLITSVLILSNTVALAGYNSVNVGFGLYITTDGGLSWQEDMNSATFLYPDFLCLHQSANGRVFSGGTSQNMSDGVIFEAPEDLSFWTYSSVTHPINSIDSYADSIVFAVGDSGYVVTNVDPAVLSIKEELDALQSIVLFPNPVSSILYIDLNEMVIQENSQIRILNLKGEVILQKKFETSIDLSEFRTGLYILELTTDKEIIRKKISKI